MEDYDFKVSARTKKHATCQKLLEESDRIHSDE